MRVFLDGVALARAAREAGVSPRTAQRWLARYREAGLAGLARAQRADAGLASLPRPEPRPAAPGPYRRRLHRDPARHLGRPPPGQPPLDQILGQASAGDILTACAFIDLARSLDHLQQLVRTLHERDIVLRCLREGIDTAGPHGQLLRAALDIVIDLRREERSEATLEGLHQARARGTRLGRPTVDHSWLDDARALRAGRRPLTEIADLLGVHRSSVYRHLRPDDESAT